MVERDDIRRAYDELAETYATGRSETGEDTKILAEFLDAFPDGSRILDAGCGPGVPVLRRVNASATGYGLDFSRVQLKLAAENVPDAPLLQADVVHLPLDDDVVDGIVAYHSLIHVPTTDQQATISEFARILRPGGRLLLSAGPTEWTGANPDWLDSGVEMRWDIAGAEATRTHLRAAGFVLTDEWDVAEDEHWLFLAARLDNEVEIGT